MPAKLSTICYVHESTERITQDFTVKQITGVSRLDDNDLTNVVYLRIKAFIPSDRTIETQIDDFENGDVVFLKGKFVACTGWYSVSNFRLCLFDISFYHFLISSFDDYDDKG